MSWWGPIYSRSWLHSYHWAFLSGLRWIGSDVFKIIGKNRGEDGSTCRRWGAWRKLRSLLLTIVMLERLILLSFLDILLLESLLFLLSFLIKLIVILIRGSLPLITIGDANNDQSWSFLHYITFGLDESIATFRWLFSSIDIIILIAFIELYWSKIFMRCTRL